MEQFFTSLNKRQTMLLLTAVTFGGSESVGVFEHLPDEEAELLRHRAQELLKIPRDKRIPLLVQEIKRLVTARRGQVWSADPEKLAQVLKQERQALVEVVLRALPLATAEAVRKLLPPGREHVKLAHEVRPQVLNIIRSKLEENLTRASPRRPGFKFSDVLLLKSREILTVCDRLGARALALAIAGLAEKEREAFLGRLKPDQRQIASRLASAAASRALREEDARQLLGLYKGDKDPAEAIRSAGTQRLARAALAQSPEFAARLMERHPGPWGALLLKWIREERPKITGKIDGGRTDVVQELERLEQKGIIDKPVRLAPPKKEPPLPPRPVDPPPRAKSASELPGGKLVAPPPKEVPVPAERPPIHRMPVPPPGRRPSGPYRDPIAERNARRAGVAVGPPEGSGPRQDPIALREARKAGAVPMRPSRPAPAGSPERASAGPQSKILRAIPHAPVERERSADAPRVVNPVGRLPAGRVKSGAPSEPRERRSEQHTSVQRPPRPGGPGRGPKGSSG